MTEKAATSAPDDVVADHQQTELLIVEGKSAADALDQIRDRRMQGIYTLQGKIPNPAKLSQTRMHGSLPFETDSSKFTQYDSIILVPDPDVDGQHNRLLLLQWFAKFLPQVIHERRLRVFPTPFERCILENGQYQYKTLEECSAQHSLAANSPDTGQQGTIRFKSLASINRDELASLLCYPLSSRSRLLTLGNGQ